MRDMLEGRLDGKRPNRREIERKRTKDRRERTLIVSTV